MLELIPEAIAASPVGGQQQPSLLGILMPFILLAVFMWLFLFRPQRKQRQEHRRMLDSLSPGDEVITSGGIVGKIRQFHANWLMIEVADGIELRIQRHAVLSTLPKGTIDGEAGEGKDGSPDSSAG